MLHLENSVEENYVGEAEVAAESKGVEGVEPEPVVESEPAPERGSEVPPIAERR